eukprot:CAMPEP_0196129852 /NCGR_PEP_ID=MMETSP0910-20130528/426_1 /TAXON_ID=49265 /ORGANISM="Thalassiosira rotula, Strain GSO102" /LENGTH=281 /DNA_ID=CAMNT_0041389047 /DNA_START=70 /DNA_END=915 /DNA_ORIENTATION=-
MSTPPPNLNDNIHITSTALHSHLANVRSKIPPSIRTICLPDSISTVLRNIILAMVSLNAFLLLTSVFTSSVKFMGYSIFLIAISSCIHVACLALLFGSHVADAFGMLGQLRLAATLRQTSARYGNDVFAFGTLFGATVVMAVLMRVASSYYGGVASCVTGVGTRLHARQRNGGYDFTGGYANTVEDGGVGQQQQQFGEDAFAVCGASVSAAVGFVSFLAGWLGWLDVALAAVMYTKKHELLTGEVGPVTQYDEIGIADNDDRVRGFAGDFPSSTPMTTMHV